MVYQNSRQLWRIPKEDVPNVVAYINPINGENRLLVRDKPVEVGK